MFIIYGARHAGRVNQPDGTYLQTLFAHLFWIPVAPIRTVRCVDGVGEVERAPFSIASALRGMAPPWLFIAAIGLLFWADAIALRLGASHLEPMSMVQATLTVSAVALVLGFVAVTTAFWTGRAPGWSTAKRFALWLVGTAGAMLVLSVLVLMTVMPWIVELSDPAGFLGAT